MGQTHLMLLNLKKNILRIEPAGYDIILSSNCLTKVKTSVRDFLKHSPAIWASNFESLEASRDKQMLSHFYKNMLQRNLDLNFWPKVLSYSG